MQSTQITILAIETSCDETAASVLRGDITSKTPKFEILSNVVKSQIAQHKKMGGVVPEVAARAHVTNIRPVVEKALQDASPPYPIPHTSLLDQIDYLAPTTGPGLIASLIVGTEFAKGLAMASDKKMIPTNHMEGHLYSPFGEYRSKGKSGKLKEGNTPQIKNIKKVAFPLIALVVSGGHTMLVHMKDERSYKVIGSTVDDAAGEAFDKVAKIMGLPYPGGPVISKLAEQGKPTINFPRPMIHSKNYDFSFSGLKTAVLYHIRELKAKSLKLKAADIARSFEEAVVDVLATKTMRAAKEYKAKTIALGGGVSANRRLRESLNHQSTINNLQFLVPPFALCTDNAAMIAIAAYMKLRAGYKPKKYTQLKADSSWEI